MFADQAGVWVVAGAGAEVAGVQGLAALLAWSPPKMERTLLWLPRGIPTWLGVEGVQALALVFPRALLQLQKISPWQLLRWAVAPTSRLRSSLQPRLALHRWRHSSRVVVISGGPIHLPA